MEMCPNSAAELSAALAAANQQRQPVGAVDLSRLSAVLDYAPEDLTITVEAGLTLAELQEQLRKNGQWLPVDPPCPEKLTLAALIDQNASGPRRYGYGPIREHLLGLTAVLADGRIVKSGGKVVKNVAGYDLHKLFVGAEGSLGVIVGVSLKLRPLPEAEHFLAVDCPNWTRAEELANALLNSELTPVVLDLHHVSVPPPRGVARLVIGFAGLREEVAWQVERAQKQGLAEAGDLAYDREFVARGASSRVSVLPSRVCEVLATMGSEPFVARLGNGVIYHQGAVATANPGAPDRLAKRLKDAFDPHHILPSLDA